MNRSHVFDLTSVDTTAITDFIGSVVVDEDGDQWIYVKNDSGSTYALYNLVSQDLADPTFGVSVLNPTTGPVAKILGAVQHTAIPAAGGGWVKRTGDLELSVYHAGVLAAGVALKSSTATAGLAVEESTITAPWIGYLVDAHSGASAAETLTVRSTLVPLVAPR